MWSRFSRIEQVVCNQIQSDVFICHRSDISVKYVWHGMPSKRVYSVVHQNFLLHTIFVTLQQKKFLQNVSFFVFFYRGNASVFILVKPVCRWATLAGSCTALNMASSLMVRCPLIKLQGSQTTPSTLSLVKPALESTFQEQSMQIWNQLLLVSVSKLFILFYYIH